MISREIFYSKRFDQFRTNTFLYLNAFQYSVVLLYMNWFLHDGAAEN